MDTPYDVIVIGGGASGMIAAGRAASLGKRVLLLEKNKKLGEKLRISGGGRCNITNNEKDDRKLLKHYGKAEQYLYSLFMQFGVHDTFVFFESKNVPLSVEANNRVFPRSQKALDVVEALTTYMKDNNVEIMTQSPVAEILVKNEKIAGVKTSNGTYFGNEYIIATGSISHPETGSTGDGFAWLKKAGHTIVDPTPTIVPLAVSDPWIKELAGTSLSDTKITFFVDEVKHFVIKGKVLFTHFGLSGPLILNNAYKVKDLLHTGVVTATIDVYPLLDQGTVEKELIALFDQYKNKELKNVIKDFIPDGIHKGIITLISNHMDVTTKVHSVTKEQRKQIAKLLKGLPCTVDGLMGFDRAVVADGGVPLEEIDMRTMRSKKISNVFITGDLLHINRPSGGFSLQLCWSTGYVAGTHAAH